MAIFIRGVGALTDSNRVGDVITTARNTPPNNKWALCNGDIVENSSAQTINNVLGNEGQTYTITDTGWYIPDTLSLGNSTIVNMKQINGNIVAFGRRYSGGTYYACIWFATSLAGPWTCKDIWSSTSSSTYISNVQYLDSMYICCGNNSNVAALGYCSSLGGSYTTYTITGYVRSEYPSGTGTTLYMRCIMDVTKLSNGTWRYTINGTYDNGGYILRFTRSTIFIGAGSYDISTFTDTGVRVRCNLNSGYPVCPVTANGKTFYLCRWRRTRNSGEMSGAVDDNGTLKIIDGSLMDIDYIPGIGYVGKGASNGNEESYYLYYSLLSSDFSTYSSVDLVYLAYPGTELNPAIIRNGHFGNLPTDRIIEKMPMLIVNDSDLLYFDRNSSKYLAVYTMDNGRSGNTLRQPLFDATYMGDSSYGTQRLYDCIHPWHMDLFKQTGYKDIIGIWKSNGYHFYRATKKAAYSILPAISQDKVYNYIKVKE